MSCPRFVSALLIVGATLPAYANATDYSGQNADNGFSYITGSGKEYWQGGLIDWYYNPTNQPSDMTTDTVVNLIKTATAKWEAVCNVKFTYKGTTSASSWKHDAYASIDRVNSFGWAAFSGEYAGYGGYTWYWYSYPNYMADANMSINSLSGFNAQNLTQLEGLYTHELGHVLGVSHSDQPASVMYANPYNSLEYQRTLRDDDIAACVSLYGPATPTSTPTPTPTPTLSTQDTIFNWAETNYSSLFNPATKTLTIADSNNNPVYYRLYSGTNTGLAVYLDYLFFYNPADGKWMNLGPTSAWLAQATAKK